MIKYKEKFNDSPGQALVEFALIITVLLMMIFLIIESARILWAWNTVQNAAREGARYAVTGNFEAPNCAVTFGADKFLQAGGRDVCDDLRLASIIEEAHTRMSGLPLNETSVTFEDDNYYNIEVWGVDEFGQFQYDFGGIPGQPVVVRVTYRVPIITPFFTPILPSIPVFGQETLNNETFGRLSGESQGAGLPPGLPPIPTAGVTPSPTPSPTPTDTPTPGNSPTPSQTPTFTPTPRCDLRFEGPALANTNFVFVTGDIGVTVTIVNLSTGQTLGSGTLGGPFDGHACQGFASITLNPGLTNANIGNVLLVEDNADPSNTDTTIVVGQPPTNTPSPTNTPVPTNTPTNTPSPSPSPTPSGPYITLLPNCGYGPDIQFSIIGINWPVNESLILYWDGSIQATYQPNQHQANFTLTWTFDNVADGAHTVRAEAGGGDFDVKQYLVPCADSPTLTPTPAITATPAPEDLVILGPPKIISTPPLVAYQPMQFSVVITNVGDIDVSSQFFVDIYLDPSTILTDSIPLNESSGYSAVSSLAGGASRVITITSPLGFQNTPQNHQVYGMVDSVQQINEALETNNVSPPLTVNNVTPAATPTPSPTPDGNSEISGIVQVLTSELLPQYRAPVLLIDESTSNVINIRQTDQNGYYQFTNAPSGTTYTVSSCMSIDGRQYYGVRTGITPPYNFANIYLLPGPCP